MDTKGTAAQTIKAFITQKHGAPAYDAWLQKLPPASRAIYDVILPSSWYRIEDAFVEPVKLLCGELYGDDERGARELGEFAADYQLNGVYKIFLKLGSPNLMASQASRVWSTYYSAGSLDLVKNEKGHLILRITGLTKSWRLFEVELLGWVIGGARLSGGKNPVGTIVQSLTTGAPYTELDMRWS